LYPARLSSAEGEIMSTAIRVRPWQTVALVVIAGCLISALSFGPRSALGLFFNPITEARGWSREVFALSLAIQNIVWGAGQPLAGAIADRYGTSRVLVGGALLYSAGLAMTAWATAPLWMHVGAGIFIGLGVAASSFTIVLAAFGRVVSVERRSLTFGIGTAAGSFGQFLFAPVGQNLIEALRIFDVFLTQKSAD
jgi:MFS family permease